MNSARWLALLSLVLPLYAFASKSKDRPPSDAIAVQQSVAIALDGPTKDRRLYGVTDTMLTRDVLEHLRQAQVPISTGLAANSAATLWIAVRVSTAPGGCDSLDYIVTTSARLLDLATLKRDPGLSLGTGVWFSQPALGYATAGTLDRELRLQALYVVDQFISKWRDTNWNRAAQER